MAPTVPTWGERPPSWSPDEQVTAVPTPKIIADRYDVLRELGRGGMGRVLLARDRKLGRDVAIKVLSVGRDTPEAIERLEREARAAGSLEHPNIVAVHDVGTYEGGPFIVTELLHGTTLREVLRQGRRPCRGLPSRSRISSTRRMTRT